MQNAFHRRMFPVLRVSFSGIDPMKRYLVLMDIVPVDNKRYRYAYHRSSWLVAGKADPPSPNRLCAHPDAPFTGDQLRKQVVSFEKVKLTNNEMDKGGHVSIILQFASMILPFTMKERELSIDFISASDTNSIFLSFAPQIVLNSMHRYQPRIHLILRSDMSSSNAPVTDLEMEKHRTFVFPECIFTAVTAYQNQLVSVSLSCLENSRLREVH
jgi:T-box protein 20